MRHARRAMVVAVGFLILPFLLAHAQSAFGQASTTTAGTATSSSEGSTTPTLDLVVPSIDTASTTDGALASQSASTTSDTASSTQVVKPISPIHKDPRTVFLQTSVDVGSHLSTGPVAATITLSNLTCRSCEKASPGVTVKAYYTAWYDNDINASSTALAREHTGEQTYSIPAIAPWESSSVEWTSDIQTPGRYSFIVVVDPDNLIGARDTYRTEFLVD